MASAISPTILHLKSHSIITTNSSSSPLNSSPSSLRPNLIWVSPSIVNVNFKSISNPFSCSSTNPFLRNRRIPNLICRSAAAEFKFGKEYKFPDPIPEFAQAETEKFRANLIQKLSKREQIFGDEVEEVVEICTEIFSNFLHTEYGGPGTLMVDPFADMSSTLNEEGLPGGPQASRLALKWAQNHVDKDWKDWTGRY